MRKPFILAAGAAFSLAVCSVTLAYSGGPDMGSPALPVMMQFDASPVAAAPHETSANDARAAASDDAPSPPSSSRHNAAKPAHDDFQRYFDRHYRAHLVLDASAHHFFEVQ